MSDSKPADHENVVQQRVDSVIDDMQQGRVVPGDVNRIADAVQRTRRDQAVARAMRG